MCPLRPASARLLLAAASLDAMLKRFPRRLVPISDTILSPPSLVYISMHCWKPGPSSSLIDRLRRPLHPALSLPSLSICSRLLQYTTIYSALSTALSCAPPTDPCYNPGRPHPAPASPSPSAAAAAAMFAAAPAKAAEAPSAAFDAESKRHRESIRRRITARSAAAAAAAASPTAAGRRFFLCFLPSDAAAAIAAVMRSELSRDGRVWPLPLRQTAAPARATGGGIDGSAATADVEDAEDAESASGCTCFVLLLTKV